MKYDVYHNWGLKTKPIVVYDKPNLEFFKEFDVKQKNEFFNQYQEFWDRQDLKYEFSAVDDEKMLNKADYDDQQQSSEKFELLDGIGKGVQLYTINRHELQLDDNVSEFSVESEKFKKKSGNYQVIQTENNRGEDIVEKKERPFLIVTSTSYTDDEDLGILFKAIERLEEISERFLKKRRIHVVITGKGPNKEKFRCYIAAKR